MTRSTMRLITALAVLAGMAAIELPRQCAAQSPCQPVVVGIDTALANTSAGAVLGEAMGQTFWARDTLIRSFTVWRIAVQDTKYIGLHLYITKTDSAGNALPLEVVFDGPTVFNYFGDGIHPVPMRFDFDPPVALPQMGLYALFLLQTPCTLGYINLLAYQGPLDPYPSGHYWWTQRSLEYGCILRPYPNSNPQAELIFEMEFCDTAVPVRSKSWGSLKLLYR